MDNHGISGNLNHYSIPVQSIDDEGNDSHWAQN